MLDLIFQKGEIWEYKTGPRDIVQMLQYEKQRENRWQRDLETNMDKWMPLWFQKVEF